MLSLAQGVAVLILGSGISAIFYYILLILGTSAIKRVKATMFDSDCGTGHGFVEIITIVSLSRALLALGFHDVASI